MTDEAKTKTPRQKALDVLIKASIIVASPRLGSAELLAVADMLADNVSEATLDAMQKKITLMAVEHTAKAAKTPLAPIADIDAGLEAK